MSKKIKKVNDNPEVQIELSLNSIVMDLFKCRSQLEYVYMKAMEGKVIKADTIKNGVLQLNNVVGLFQTNIEQLIEKGLLIKRETNGTDNKAQ
tara:strand:+ start:225 stop:503 length:279 start_codon:yes stop_codon:yes gene_type:complete